MHHRQVDVLPGALKAALQRISTGLALEPGLAGRAFEELTRVERPALRDACLVGLFTGLMARGPVEREVLEVVEAALALDPREAVALPCDGGRVVAVAGSGKKGHPLPNVSTPGAIVASAAGCPVVKVGSRSTSSTLGSRDLARCLGLAENRTEVEVVTALRRDRFAFVPVEDAIPSVDLVYGGRLHVVNPFSFGLAPLAVPFRADVVVYGLAHPRVELAARVFARFGIRDAMVVSSLASTGRYVDELGGARESAVCELRSGEVGAAVTYGPGDLPGLWVGRGALDGAPETVEDAVKTVVDVIAGRGPEPYVELVALNAAVVLVASGLVADLHSGYDLAVATIRCGRALEHLERLGGVESCLAV